MVTQALIAPNAAKTRDLTSNLFRFPRESRFQLERAWRRPVSGRRSPPFLLGPAGRTRDSVARMTACALRRSSREREFPGMEEKLGVPQESSECGPGCAVRLAAGFPPLLQ